MTISRKEFICRGIFAFCQELAGSLTVGASDSIAGGRGEENGYLQLDNSRCLAQRGGCFACIDHCPQEAITIVLGRGIAIDGELCDGCGECAAVCPMNPKVIAMKAHKTEPTNPR